MAMSDCLTCNNSTLGDDLVVAISANREAQNAFNKHFWFDEEEYLQSVLCYTCWHKIEDFHRFYCEVRRIHARPLCYQALIEVEQESRPVDFVLEVPAEQASDCMVVENGEIYSIKYDNPQVDVVPEPSEQPSECFEAEEVGEDVEENDADVPRSSKKRGTKRPRLRKNEKDAVQEYVSRNLILNCDTCSERSETFELLQRHSMMEHAKHATVVCCNSKFSDVSRFVNHIQYHLDPDLFRCDYCFQQCISRDALKKHLRIEHNTDPDNSMTVPEEIELSVMRTEVVDEGSSCMQKSDAYENLNSSENEDEEDEDEGDYDSRQSEPAMLKTLKLTPEEKAQVQTFVEKNRKLECDMCSELFTRFDDLQKHSINKHKKRKTGLCCNRKFRYKGIFIAHMLYHVNPERFKCTECTRICPSWDALKVHMQRMHKSVKEKYPCPLCIRSFRTKLAVLQHAERHEEQADDNEIDNIIAQNYNLQCDTCQKQHVSYRALQRHSAIEHGKLAAVFCCKKKMAKRAELYDHYRYHQDPNTFTCKLCLKTWHHSSALRHHIKYKHPDEWRKIRTKS